jgi:hypothetical protein
VTVQEREQGSVQERVQEQVRALEQGPVRVPVRVRVQEQGPVRGRAQALVRQPAEPPERLVRQRFPFPGRQEEARRACLQLHFL